MKIVSSLMVLAVLMSPLSAFAKDEGPSPDFKGRPNPEKMFERADANKDGLLTKDEMSEAHKKHLDKMFEELDTDKDGKLSKDELAKGRDKMKERFKERLENRKNDKSDEGGN